MTVHRMVESKMKKQCEEKEFGNSVHLRIFGHVLSISKHTRTYSYILVYTSTYSYIIIQHRVLTLAEYVRDCWSPVTSQKQWDKKNSAHQILDISHVEVGDWGWFIQIDHSSGVLHRPLNRQFELFKGTEENQGVYYVIRAGFCRFCF